MLGRDHAMRHCYCQNCEERPAALGQTMCELCLELAEQLARERKRRFYAAASCGTCIFSIPTDKPRVSGSGTVLLCRLEPPPPNTDIHTWRPEVWSSDWCSHWLPRLEHDLTTVERDIAKQVAAQQRRAAEEGHQRLTQELAKEQRLKKERKRSENQERRRRNRAERRARCAETDEDREERRVAETRCAEQRAAAKITPRPLVDWLLGKLRSEDRVDDA